MIRAPKHYYHQKSNQYIKKSSGRAADRNECQERPLTQMVNSFKAPVIDMKSYTNTRNTFSIK